MIRRLTFWLRLWGRTCVLPASLIARPTNGADEKKEEAEILLGGQAVLEGVMMRAPQSYCVAVRAPGGEIVQKREALARPQDRWRGWRLPGLRGLATLGQSLVLGLRALRFSADVALEEESKKTGKKQELPGWLLALQLVFSLAFFIFLYKFVPLLVATWFKNRGLEGGWLGFNLIDGFVRIGLFLAFLFAISRWGDIRRVFEYHGAEHMVVYNWEAKQPVSVGNARAFTPEHPRCGTSFLVVVLLVALFVYALVPVQGFGLQFLVRILLLPLIAGASYEVIRAAAKRQSSALWRVMVTPGLWLQRAITTRHPADDQIEVAIHALNGTLELERATEQPAPATVN
jgi:uncharacterized protein YqhQ